MLELKPVPSSATALIVSGIVSGVSSATLWSSVSTTITFGRGGACPPLERAGGQPTATAIASASTAPAVAARARCELGVWLAGSFTGPPALTAGSQ